MDALGWLERRFRRWAIPNLTLYLIIGQTMTLAALLMRPEIVWKLLFIPAAVADGEVWRILTFIFMPPTMHPLWAFFALYFFYLMGTALEAHWGSFRYNVYILIGIVMTMGSACFFPEMPATNAFIGGSVFLAFAYLFPDFQILLFFLIPVRIKWLAMLTWIGYGWVMVTGSWLARALVLASIANFLLFFGAGLARRAKSGHRRMIQDAHDRADAQKAFHTCTVCGVTEKSNPKMEFRYCPDCAGVPCYCIDHIFNHAHIPGAAKKDA